MRITQQMIVQNSLNLSKSTSVDLKSLVGKVIEGQIINIKGENLATVLSGDMTLTVNIGDLNLKESQAVKLEILEHKEGVLLANLLKDSPAENAGSKLVELFSKLGVSDSPENRAIVETMKFSEIPLTKENFVALKQGMNEIKTLSNELVKAEMPNLPSQMEMPLKSMVINLIQKSSDANPPQGTVPNVISPPTTEMVIPEKTMVKEPSSGIAQAILNDFEIKSPLDQDFINKGSNIKQTSNEQFQEAVVSLLKQVDYKQEALVLKNDLPLTLKNLFIAYDVLGGKGTTARIINVVNELKQVALPLETLTEMIEVISSSKSHKEKLEWISSIISETLPESESKDDLMKELTVLKESVSFTRSLNEQMMMMQMPIPINDQLKHVEIYYKRRKQKTDPEDLTLLIALNTHHYGEVRCLIHKGKEDYQLNFSLPDLKTKDVFESNRELLNDALENLLGKKFKVTFAVKVDSDDAWFNTAQSDSLETLGFDLKV